MMTIKQAFISLFGIQNSGPILLLQLAPHSLKLVIAKKISNDTFTIINQADYPLSNQECSTQSIMQPSIINTLINQFCNTQPISPVSSVAFIDFSPPAPRLPFLVLQTALCLGKNKLPLQHMGLGKLPLPHSNTLSLPPTLMAPDYNLLALLTSQDYRHASLLYRRLTYALAITGCCLSIVHLGTLRMLKKYSHASAASNTSITQLKQDIIALKKVETENSALSDKIAMLAKLSNEQEAPHHLLTAIAQSIPTNTWLTKIALGKQPKSVAASPLKMPKTNHKTPNFDDVFKKGSRMPIHLEGLTQQPDEISDFLNDLTGRLPTLRLAIKHIKRKPRSSSLGKGPEEGTTPYLFVLTGTLALQQAKPTTGSN